MNTFGSSISYGNSPLDQLVGKTLTNNVRSFISIPSISRFHLIENGEHFLLISRIERVQHEFFDGKKVIIDRDLQIKNKKYSFEDARRDHFAPKSKGAFICDISKFPLLQLDTEKPSSSVEHEDNRSFVVGKMKVSLSRELQDGILGIRGQDHAVSLDLLKRCMIKKRKHISHNPKFNFYFFDKEKSRVLNLVAAFDQSEVKQTHITIITAYYPVDNVMKYRLNNCTDTYYEAWKARLPQV